MTAIYCLWGGGILYTIICHNTQLLGLLQYLFLPASTSTDTLAVQLKPIQIQRAQIALERIGCSFPRHSCINSVTCLQCDLGPFKIPPQQGIRFRHRSICTRTCSNVQHQQRGNPKSYQSNQSDYIEALKAKYLLASGYGNIQTEAFVKLAFQFSKRTLSTANFDKAFVKLCLSF